MGISTASRSTITTCVEIDAVSGGGGEVVGAGDEEVNGMMIAALLKTSGAGGDCKW